MSTPDMSERPLASQKQSRCTYAVNNHIHADLKMQWSSPEQQCNANKNIRNILILGHHQMLQGSTFGTPGVEEHALFLRDVANATAIRSALIKNWMLANIPGKPTTFANRIGLCMAPLLQVLKLSS